MKINCCSIIFLIQLQISEEEVTEIAYVVDPSFGSVYQYQQMVMSETNEKANELISRILELDGTIDIKLSRSFKVERIQMIVLNEKTSLFFESYLQEVCKPFIPGGISSANLPVVVADYDF